MLPFLLSRLGFDPATSSTPFVATLVDVTGIGLPLEEGAEKMQGEIEVECEPGTGARFWLELKPVTRPST